MTEVEAAELAVRGEEALTAGDWEGAREAFVAAVGEEPSPQALDGLGRTLWWLGDVDGAIEHRERAWRRSARRSREGFETMTGTGE